MSFSLLQLFLHPLALLAAPLSIATLVYVYRKRGQGERVVVASTILLRSLKRVAAVRNKFSPPWRFFFELLLLTLLTLAAAGMIDWRGGKDYVLIIDNSLSMAAKAENGPTQLEKAKEEARAYLKSVPTNARIALWQVAPKGGPIENAPLSPVRAASLLERIDLAFSPDRLASVIASASEESSPTATIVVYTDHPDSSDKAAARQVFVQTQSAADKDYSNLALTSLVRRATTGGSTVELLATIHAFTKADRQFSLTVDSLNSATGTWKRERTVDQSLKAGDESTVTISQLPANREAYRVTIRPTGADALKYDNTAWVTGDAGSGVIQIVSPLSSQALEVEEITNFKFDVVTPEKLSSSETSPLIYHRAIPDALPNRNALFVSPPPVNQLFDSERTIESAKVTNWLESHPALSYLNLPQLKLGKSLVFKTLPWTEEIIKTSDGAVALAGERDGFRYAALGFEIFPFEGKGSPIISILTLNLLKWISLSKSGAGFLTTNSNTGDLAQAKYIDQLPDRRPTVNEMNETVVFAEPGLVSAVRNGAPTLIGVNFFDLGEGNTLTADPIRIAALDTQRQESELLTPSLTRYLVLILLALLTLDLALLFLGSRMKVGLLK